MITIAAFIFVLGVLIFVHELGHFLAAKSVNVAVLRFSFGLGPKTPLVWKRGETEYCLSWIPFGGYVKMAGLEEEPLEGEQPEALDVPKERTFDAKPLWARSYIISAGVVMNTLFAVVVYSVLTFVQGVATDPSTTVGEVRADSLPAGAIGLTTLRPGDRLLRINGDTLEGWADVEEALTTATATPLRIEVAGRTTPVMVDIPLSRQRERLAALTALVPWHEPLIGVVTPGGPADRGGIRAGDRIVRIDGDTIPAWEVLVDRIEASPESALAIAVARGDSIVELSVTPRREIERSASGDERPVGKVGFGVQLPYERFGIGGSIVQGVKRTGRATGLILFGLKAMFTGQLSLRELGGPILVGQMSGEAARLGWGALFGFMALFSINLAIINLLPIPVLDGGHLLFMMIEAVRRKPLSVAVRQRATQAGLFLLLAIMILAVFNDITRVLQKLLS